MTRVTFMANGSVEPFDDYCTMDVLHVEGKLFGQRLYQNTRYCSVFRAAEIIDFDRLERNVTYCYAILNTHTYMYLYGLTR